MRKAAAGLIHRRNSQMSEAASTSGHVPRTPTFNALKHGLRSGHVLLPGDNVAEFRRLRHRLFHLHKPRTIAEAKQVETLAANEWRAARCRLEQRFFKDHLGAAMSGHPDATGYLCDPDLHRLHHRGTDCHKEERRLEKSMSEAEAALTRLQTQRTENLIPAIAAVLEPYEVFLAEGEPAVEEEPPAEAAPPPENSAATPSDDGTIGIGSERNAAPLPVTGPPRWNRRARRGMARETAQLGKRGRRHQADGERRLGHQP